MQMIMTSLIRIHKQRGLLLKALAGAMLLSTATQAMAVDGVVSSADGAAFVAIGKPHRYADVLLDTDQYTGRYQLTPNASDVGKAARLLLVAKVDQRWFAHDGSKWQPWNGANLNELPTFASKVLAAQETLSFLTDDQLYAADYEVYAGYQVGSAPVVYRNMPLKFSVDNDRSDGLLSFRTAEAMESFLKEGLQNNRSYAGDTLVTLAATTGTATTKSAERTSSTNVQEQGVDEADTIKVDGNLLYALSACKEASCLDVKTLDSSKPAATDVASVQLSGTSSPSGLYLVDKGIGGNKQLVTVGGENNFGYGIMWSRVWGGWHEGKTQLEFFNISNPQKPASVENFKIDGALVASRRVGNTLYLVTRYTPMPKGYQPYAWDKKDQEKNSEVLAVATLPTLLPQIVDSREQVEALIKSKDCYLATSAVDGSYNPSIITVISMPLDAPKNYSATCFLGASETLYMSTNALYLATTGWDHIRPATLVASDSEIYSPNHTTTVHKFALVNGKTEYRGSGEVKGHLGWEEDKKSFRMGENKGYLNIATSIGETWTNNSSTSLVVLNEDAAAKKLKMVKTIDGIGLPGERLYAARFVGDRGYLVTFRVTDPLYVLDLSNQEQPKLAGELKITGYSDYLHPLEGNLLLGIGKDAVPDTSSPDMGGGRGAWYQGVKLSLFDVSNIAAPKEINSLVIGKRGTSSEVLYDHHALSFLPAVGMEPARLAIPVQLHDRIPQWEGWKASEPSAWYDYTHTGLYTFEISKLGVSQVAKLISEVAVDPKTSGDAKIAISAFAPYSFNYADRSVLKDNAVFYLHNGKVLSAKWGESRVEVAK